MILSQRPRSINDFCHVVLETGRDESLVLLAAPVPFFVGLPGFRSKLWAVDPSTGECQGTYQWATAADAGNYAGSFAMRFMTRWSAPGSLSYRIIPVQDRLSS